MEIQGIEKLNWETECVVDIFSNHNIINWKLKSTYNFVAKVNFGSFPLFQMSSKKIQIQGDAAKPRGKKISKQNRL